MTAWNRILFENLPEFAQDCPGIVVAQDLTIALTHLGHANGAGLAHAHAMAESSTPENSCASLHLHDEERTAQVAEGLPNAQFSADYL
jgi:hypothetical protein